ncbi:unnamed protein product, partial [Hapterophycus canaliculatus]
RLAFDFDAVSNAFRDHLKSEGVDFRANATNPTSLRKVFASLDRKRAGPAAKRASFDKMYRATDPDGHCVLGDVFDGGWGNSVTKRASRENVDDRMKDTLRTYDSGFSERGESISSLPEQNGLQKDSPGDDAAKTSVYDEGTGEVTVLPPTNESWTFDNFLQDQRRKEIQHEVQKEKLFHKEDRQLALQRQSLNERHLPGSADRVGEDPLAPVAGCTTTVLAPQEREGSGVLSPRRNPRCPEEPEEDGDGDDGAAFFAHCGRAGAGPVRLELGMDSEVLEKILDEHEVITCDLNHY